MWKEEERELEGRRGKRSHLSLDGIGRRLLLRKGVGWIGRPLLLRDNLENGRGERWWLLEREEGGLDNDTCLLRTCNFVCGREEEGKGFHIEGEGRRRVSKDGSRPRWRERRKRLLLAPHMPSFTPFLVRSVSLYFFFLPFRRRTGRAPPPASPAGRWGRARTWQGAARRPPSWAPAWAETRSRG